MTVSEQKLKENKDQLSRAFCNHEGPCRLKADFYCIFDFMGNQCNDSQGEDEI